MNGGPAPAGLLRNLDAAIPDALRSLHEGARIGAFGEAVTWQNRHALRTGLDVLLGRRRGPPALARASLDAGGRRRGLDPAPSAHAAGPVERRSEDQDGNPEDLRVPPAPSTKCANAREAHVARGVRPRAGSTPY